MTLVQPEYSKRQVDRAGDILAAITTPKPEDLLWALKVLANWRGSHAYPINTFQATLRLRLKGIDTNALVAQRMKRTPSIVSKLQRFEGMQLSRMQDIGGLRAVVADVKQLRILEKIYENSKFKHKLISFKDYLNEPKRDGYRSIHLVYRYMNDVSPEYDGLSVELQFRTKLQHAWATSVETMGTFLGQALKSGQGENDWREFFRRSSAALAIIEESPPVPGFEGQDKQTVYESVVQSELRLRVLDKLRGFAVAADRITTERGQGTYHLVILNSYDRSVVIKPYAAARLEQATLDYAAIEERVKAGEPIEAVLVSAGPIETLKKAYPNYFLDTQVFVEQIEKISAFVAFGPS